MLPAYPDAFEREMACTTADWLRWLPAAVGEQPWEAQSGCASVRIAGGVLHLRWRAGEPRTIALVRLPRLHVSFRFEGVAPGERDAFMRRFDLYLQRGGG
jgi:hypothetical protein